MDEESLMGNKMIEDQFYNDFKFLEEDPMDPFLNFEGNFKKKNDNEIMEEIIM